MVVRYGLHYNENMKKEKDRNRKIQISSYLFYTGFQKCRIRAAGIFLIASHMLYGKGGIPCSR